MNITLLTANEITEALHNEVKELFEQLNPTIIQQPLEILPLDNEHLVLAICHIDGQLAGMASMATYKVISGYKGMVEDVVVAAEFRGKGIGRALMEKLLGEAQRLQLTEILLFSGHHREAAIKLYTSLGFKLKQSGLYTLKIS